MAVRSYAGGLIILTLAVVFWFKFDNFLAGPFFFVFVSISFTVFLLLEFGLATFVYRPAGDKKYLPTLSLVMPAFYEGRIVYQTAAAAAGSTYPKDLLEIVIVNDGSTDNTRAELYRAQQDFGIRTIHLEKNSGKRKAVVTGFKESKGEIVAVMDSDTFLAPDALYNGVQNFSSRNVGAVCGHGKVHNKSENVLTKMQDAWYDGMFTVFKGAESVFGMVTCCSGLLSFYRRKSITGMMDSWASETFLGIPVKAGEDRALTNIVLRPRVLYASDADDRILTNVVAKRGEDVVYASNAVAYTIVPNTLRKFFRQQVRWKRGWFRGNLQALTFMWKKHPLGSLLYYLHTLLAYLTPVVIARMLFLPVIEGRLLSPMLYVAGLLYVGVLYALYYAVREPRGTWPYRMLFQVTYNLFVSPFLSLFAWVTIRRESWMTR
jgi:hyaluronan synthase